MKRRVGLSVNSDNLVNMGRALAGQPISLLVSPSANMLSFRHCSLPTKINFCAGK